MADRDHLQTAPVQDAAQLPGGLGLARPGAYRADGDDGLVAAEGYRAVAHEYEVRPEGQHQRGLVHELGVRYVAVGEHHLVHLVPADDRSKVVLRQYRDAGGVQRPCQGGRVAPPLYVRDLSGGEGDHVVPVVVTEIGVEVVEVAPSGAHDHYLYPFHVHGPLPESMPPLLHFPREPIRGGEPR